jgi:hypothetical protein
MSLSTVLHEGSVRVRHLWAQVEQTGAITLIKHVLMLWVAVLVAAIKGRTGPFKDGVIAGPFHAIMDCVQYPAHVKTPPQAALFHALKEAGWVDMGRIHSRDYNTKKHIFRAPELAGMLKSDLRAMVEKKPATAG